MAVALVIPVYHLSHCPGVHLLTHITIFVSIYTVVALSGR